MTIRWTHLTIPVSDFERSIDFYASYCGLEVLRDRRREGFGTVWLGRPTGAGELPQFLLVLGSGQVASPIDHLGFQCDERDDIDRLAERARAHGILIDPPTDSGPPIGYWTMLRDPDGHLVEFTHGQPVAGS